MQKIFSRVWNIFAIPSKLSKFWTNFLKKEPLWKTKIWENPFKKIFQEKKTIIAELLIQINKSKNLLVIDVIEFDKQNKIKSIRAYLGS